MKRWKMFATLSAIAIAIHLANPNYFTIDNAVTFCTTAEQCHPSWIYYEYYLVNPGDDLDEVIRMTRPSVIIDRADLTTLEYRADGKIEFSGHLSAMAYRGKIIQAGAESRSFLDGFRWGRIYFDAQTPAMKTEICELLSHLAHCDSIERQMRKNAEAE